MLVDDYYKLHQEYTKKYGPKTIILLHLGSFYEIYAECEVKEGFTSSIDTTKCPDIFHITDILGINCVKTDKNKADAPYMAGFPCYAIHRHLKKLLQNNYTVVVFKQEEKSIGGPFKRNLECIYTPSTYIDDEETSLNYMIGLYLEICDTDLIAKKLGKVYYLGLTIIDITTGELMFIEEHFYSYEKLSSFISSFNIELQPKEYILFLENSEQKTVDSELINLVKFLGKKYTSVNLLEKYNNKHYKLDYQKEFFNRIYKSNSLIPIFEYLNLTRYDFARISILLTLDFCYSLNDKLLKYIQRPKIYKCNNLLIGNDGINQLNIVDNNSSTSQKELSSYKSVYDVINNCITPMGKRFLYKKIVNPCINPDEIQVYYDLSTSVYNNMEFIINILKRMKDIERLSRKIMMLSINPNELGLFYESILEVEKLLVTVDINLISKLLSLNSYGFDININEGSKDDVLHSINIFKKFFIDNFKIERLKNCNGIKEVKENIINDNELNQLENEIKKDNDIYDITRKKFSQLLAEKKEVVLEIKDNKDGKFISTTVRRGKKIEENLQEKDKDNYDFVYKKSCQIFIKKVDTGGYNELMETFLNLTRQKYYIIIENMNQFSQSFYLWTLLVSIIDFCINNCILKNKFGYSQPEIVKDTLVKAEKLRHPVIEQIISKEYIPNDIDLNEDNHILLFGVNSSGKSSLQKSLGIAIILAQSGCYVASSKFIFYPFKKLFVRITGNDNIFKGLSSFSVEMNELKTILENKGKDTLVIGDEVCRGTEYSSAISILASSLIQLTKSNTSFIFATHYHEIVDISDIKDLKISIFHMSVDIDDQENLIYGRHLLRGKCEDNYGLLVAKSIIKDTDFIKEAEKFSRELNNEKISVLATKQSRYNSRVYMDSCSVCGGLENLETHHIEQQKDSDKYKVIDKPHIRKNSIANLVVLCEKCHDILHNENKKIVKLETSKGIEIKLI